MKTFRVEKTASFGIAVAPVYLYREPDLVPLEDRISEDAVQKEKEKFMAARAAVIEELLALPAENEILAAHLELVRDVSLAERVEMKIVRERKNAQLALSEAIREFSSLFDAMEDSYLRERGEDVRDIGKRMMAKLKGVDLPDLRNLPGEVIVVARDLYPSDMVKMDAAHVKGIITEEGGVTSHVSILAKNMGIPILAGAAGILSQLADGEMLCMDAGEGVIAVDPDEAVLAGYRQRQRAGMEERARLTGLRTQPLVARDGKRILMCANVGSVEEIRKALPMQIDGVGLFRTELLFMGSARLPTEEEQYRVYREAAAIAPGELTIRTLDIGGDKELPGFPAEKEGNPFLGWRGIRVSLGNKELFRAQLRAILRSGAAGHVRILFPMVISVEEFREAKMLLEACKAELREEGLPFAEQVPVGLMVETPASVLLADEFAAEADFFSIGTNDLTQYLLAVDRGNPKVADRYDVFHPAVLKAIRQVIEAGHRAGIPVGMCGEMAGDPEAAGLLLEMGLDEFSMSAGSLDYVREKLLEKLAAP